MLEFVKILGIIVGLTIKVVFVLEEITSAVVLNPPRIALSPTNNAKTQTKFLVLGLTIPIFALVLTASSVVKLDLVPIVLRVISFRLGERNFMG